MQTLRVNVSSSFGLYNIQNEYKRKKREATDPPVTLLSQMRTFQNNVSKERSSNTQKQQTHNQSNLLQEYIGLKAKYTTNQSIRYLKKAWRSSGQCPNSVCPHSAHSCEEIPTLRPGRTLPNSIMAIRSLCSTVHNSKTQETTQVLVSA